MKKMDSRGAIYAVLPRLQFTSGVPDTKYELLLRLFRVRERVYQKDATIFMSGTSAAVFGALVAGRVQSTSFDFLGNKKIIAEYHAWECFAVTNVSCSIGEYAFDYVAAEPSRVLLFDITEIFQPTAAFAMSDRLLAAELMHN